MVDVMAPVFDHLDEEEDTSLRSRRGDLWLRDVRDTNGGRDLMSARSSRLQDKRRHRLRLSILIDRDNNNDDDDDGDDDDDDDGDGSKRRTKDAERQKNRQNDGGNGDGNGAGNGSEDADGDGVGGGSGGASSSTLDPLNPLPAVGTLVAPSPPALLRSSERPALTPLPSPTPISTPTRTSTLLPLPTTTANTPVAVNPAASIAPVVTLSSVTIVTTTSSISLSLTRSQQSFISTIFPPSTTSSTSASAAFDNAPPTPTVFISSTSDPLDDGDHRDGDHHGDDHSPPPGGLSPTAEDVLISAGSIGAFILICFVCWMGWRMYKKHNRAKNGMNGDDFSQPNALIAKIPYFGRNQRGWQDLDNSAKMRSSPPMYDRVMGTKTSMYSMADPRHMAQSPARQDHMALPQLDTNVAFSHVNPFSASTQSSAFNPQSAHSPQSFSMQNALSYSPQQQQQQQPVVLPQLQTNFGPSVAVNNPFASPEDALVSNYASPNSAVQYGNGTAQTFETTTTDRSRMPDTFFNQSELARQASTAYDPTRRAVYRASELSSISSGFGDGDIIVPPPATLQPGPAPRPFSYVKAPGLSRSNSVANRSEAGSNGQRDTVYTATSEDMPARYRSVNSWVNQQTGRIQRQQQTAVDEDVPPVPSLPPEERYTMMMDDDQEPRRYEDTLSSQPPVPTVPAQHATTKDPKRPASMSSIGENGKTDTVGRPLTMPPSPQNMSA